MMTDTRTNSKKDLMKSGLFFVPFLGGMMRGKADGGALVHPDVILTRAQHVKPRQWAKTRTFHGEKRAHLQFLIA